ncbi:MAG: RNA-binding S4 domain-containing protein [Crocinitomicaceae bacterium]|nr:RNA-binding S4 domain-containing protein [Crocinitomicaceae bacterium]
MEEISFELKGEYIELIQLLKVLQIAQTGGHAKLLVEDDLVSRNGKLETRKRAKIVKGDIINVGEIISVRII